MLDAELTASSSVSVRLNGAWRKVLKSYVLLTYLYYSANIKSIISANSLYRFDSNCASMDTLMQAVTQFMTVAQPWPGNRHALALQVEQG